MKGAVAVLDAEDEVAAMLDREAEDVPKMTPDDARLALLIK